MSHDEIDAQVGRRNMWTIRGHSEEYGWVYLFGYSGSTRSEVEQKLMDGARRENFHGSLQLRLDDLKWEIVMGNFVESSWTIPASPGPALVPTARQA